MWTGGYYLLNAEGTSNPVSEVIGNTILIVLAALLVMLISCKFLSEIYPTWSKIKHTTSGEVKTSP